MPAGMTSEMPAKMSTVTGMVSTYVTISFICGARIFLPRSSGVRPTISPATNTASSASTRTAYRPPPSPPGLISPSRMPAKAPVPPTGV